MPTNLKTTFTKFPDDYMSLLYNSPGHYPKIQTINSSNILGNWVENSTATEKNRLMLHTFSISKIKLTKYILKGTHRNIENEW